ncbi:MAG: Mor transcription activator family protein [Gallionella sp.]|nr:Mor transcription activator family protein [Gallionella sp.]
MTRQPEDELVVHIANIAAEAISRALLNLAPAIRDEITTSIRKKFSGEQIYIPKALTAQKEQRNEAMRVDRAAGMSFSAIAHKHHISKSQASNILKGRGR